MSHALNRLRAMVSPPKYSPPMPRPPTGLSIIERASALAAHCLASVLLIYAVRTRRQLWFWLSFGYKTLTDTFAAWAILAWKMPGSTTKTAEFEVVIAIFALIALVALPRLKTGFIRLNDASRLPLPAPV
jgi:YhfC intramembrane metalloprotease